jgi:proteasome assembly chaperone (PAC2) family protein
MSDKQHEPGTGPSPNDDLIISERPQLRRPIMLVAFEGWNDAAEGATGALEFLQDAWDTTPFAEIDAEEFYDFTEVRPMVGLDDNNERRIDWPSNEFSYYRDPEHDRDFIVFIGVEPSLKWRRFTKAFLDIVREFEVSTLITVGALLADVPHGRPSRVNVTATDEALRARLGRQTARGSRYEGPTGIVGILTDACVKAGIGGASFWGHAPHYLSASPNPMVTLGILRRLDELLDLKLDLQELSSEADTFVAQVNEAVAHDPEATSYINSLETQNDDHDDDDDDEAEAETFRRSRNNNTGKGLIQDVEDFLRRRRSTDE